MKQNSGFTLIQMSIVLVIIGLLVGGILTGQNLINAAAISAQVTQIQKYQTAVNLFQTKYNGYLPGDIPDPYASNFGFQARGQYAGEGDGNGILQSDCNNTANNSDNFQAGCGELAVFWQDLSIAALIDLNVPSGGNGYPHTNGQSNGTVNLSSSPGIKDWLPAGKIGQGTFMYIHSLNGINYYSVSTVTNIGWNIESTANPGLTVQQAYNIDIKIDDGLPQSGSVTACYMNWDVAGDQVVWAAGGPTQGATGGTNCVPTTNATAYGVNNCYDNNNIAGTETYSISKNANARNCALSFQFQTQ